MSPLARNLLIGTALVGAVVVVGSCTVSMMSSSNGNTSRTDWEAGVTGTVQVPQQAPTSIPPVIIYRDQQDRRIEQANAAEQALLVVKCTSVPDFYHWNQWACQRAGVMTAPSARNDNDDRSDRLERQRRAEESARIERQRRVDAENALAQERTTKNAQIAAAAAIARQRQQAQDQQRAAAEATAAAARLKQQAQDRAAADAAAKAQAAQQAPSKTTTFNNTLDGGKATMTVRPMVIPDTKSYLPSKPAAAPAPAPAPAEGRYDKYKRLEDPNCCGAAKPAAAPAPAPAPAAKVDFGQKSSGYGSQTMTFNKPAAAPAPAPAPAPRVTYAPAPAPKPYVSAPAPRPPAPAPAPKK